MSSDINQPTLQEAEAKATSSDQNQAEKEAEITSLQNEAKEILRQLREYRKTQPDRWKDIRK